MRHNGKSFIMAGIAVCFLFSGCSAGKGSGEQEQSSETYKPSTEPVTIRIATTPSASVTEDDFRLLFTEPVKAKYPHITLELVKYGNGSTVEDWIASGSVPDMMLVWNGELGGYAKYDLLEAIDPLIKKHGLDLTRFDGIVLDAVRAISSKSELYGLPYAVQLNALYYNKDIFDKFGTSYPKDGMTWDEAIDLAKRLTREEGGVQYRGLHPETIMRLAFPFSINLINPKTNRADINNDSWKSAFDVMGRIIGIPGNWSATPAYTTAFMKDQNVAMLASINLFDQLEKASKDGFTNWDVAQYPSYPDKPNVYGMVDTHIVAITKTSKHKDQALQVADVITSLPVQNMLMQRGRLSSLSDTGLKKRFGEELPSLKGKRIDSIFKSKPAPGKEFSPYFAEARTILLQGFNEFVAGKDANTVLREAEEQVNAMLSQK
ncbi:ABC transporter substrate-binding protein [Paenibacillus ginsengarvi]|uniref:Extracellular solute-binding protein n=1 Tax=Paenibacillus ginsengarvi TaxID=400777 RepID=A0A3B0CCC2_9BACL|nr:extracellular solute-binding protein [Paenibacillus ginsengarvi]RKN82241.1 extracellular solute-binding protein [Paenibacillus ginsengarvi]